MSQLRRMLRQSDSSEYTSADNLPYEKVGKNEPVCIADEVPFEIPDTWEWVRLANICTKLVDGDHNPPKGEAIRTSFIMASSTNINNDTLVDLEKVRFLSETVFIRENERTQASVGDIFFTSVGSLGRSCVYQGGLNICFQRSVSVLTTLVYNYYLKYFFDSGYVQQKVFAEATGTAQKGFYLNQMAKLIVPVPPLPEQHRIVEGIRGILPLLTEYSKKEIEISALQSSFPDQLKKSILQEAVQGKLVPQDPADEPASILLERIRAEKEQMIKAGKIKRDKHESVIFRRDNSHYEKRGSEEVCIDDEIPFEIPENWCWARMGSCLDVRDGTHDTPKYVLEGIPLVTSKNLCNGKIDFSTAKFISREDHLAISLRSKVDAGDIMYAMIGSIGNPVLYNGNAEFSIKNMALFKKIANGLDMEYVYWFLYLSQDTMKKFASGGVQSFVSLGYLRNYWIPVPPIQEQHRIVTAIKQILPKISTL